MNRLDKSRRALVIRRLVEGNSIRATVRMTGVAKNTVVKLLAESGKACEESTSYVERQNLTMRMQMRRFTRLINAFSKKVGNLGHVVALHFMYYNLCITHQTLRVTPALVAGISDHVWTTSELVGLLEREQIKSETAA